MITQVVDPAETHGDHPVPGLHLGEPGVSVHRCHALMPADRLVLDGLGHELPGEAAPPLPAMMVSAHEEDQLGLLDGLMGSPGSRPRACCLVDETLLAAIFEHASAVGLELGIAVIAEGLLQATQGRIHSIGRVEGRVAVVTAEAVVELAPHAIGAVTVHHCHGPHGPTTVLVARDLVGRAVLALTPLGLVAREVHEAWEALAASLPDTPHRLV